MVVAHEAEQEEFDIEEAVPITVATEKTEPFPIGRYVYRQAMRLWRLHPDAMPTYDVARDAVLEEMGAKR